MAKCQLSFTPFRVQGVRGYSQSLFTLLSSLSPFSRFPFRRPSPSQSKSQVYCKLSIRIIWLFIAFRGPEAVDTVEHLKVVVTITNTKDGILKVLDHPRGPFKKLPTDNFVINDSKGSQPLFTGIKLKYFLQSALGAYTTLAPGKSEAVQHDRSPPATLLPFFKGCGLDLSGRIVDEGKRNEGGPMKWEAQFVRIALPLFFDPLTPLHQPRCE